MRVVAVVLSALVLTGCASDATTGGASANTPPPTSEAPTPSATPTATPTATPSRSPEEAEQPQRSEAVPCEDVMFQRAQNTIRSQQSAFANGDFTVARGYASDSFRESVTVEQFQGIIEGTYGFLLNSPELTFTDCQRAGETAYLQVEVAGSPITVMAYRMTLENESWFIDGAAIAGSREDVTA